MNWVGGMRNRLKGQDEKKRQREFFERKKCTKMADLGLHHTNYLDLGANRSSLGNNICSVSQDLLSFQTVTRMHAPDRDGRKRINEKKPRILKLDGERRPRRNVDLALSPQLGAERLELRRGKNLATSCKKVKSEKSKSKSAYDIENICEEELKERNRKKPRSSYSESSKLDIMDIDFTPAANLEST